MDVACKINFKYMAYDESLGALIRRKVARLDRIFNHVVTCSVYMEKSQKRNEPTHGVYRMRVEVFVPPRKELVVKRQSKMSEVSPRLRALVSETFEAAERELIEEKMRALDRNPGRLR